ncbi:hypothetical protein M406DRAFT_65645 [Cryphonectria parasitica EP155]|uniref:Uncharacterized protein n=1 Tax=Cryphonectria parasitica (strain ATCC 38755 / EP155) TaxID=660469 RepID=A0A9P5CTG0_CRYP1|nr:uncharacterized protein M406DRAFT_65645 [Cryphonectria parasitica EP155]KAF3769371.1 hypothetical protein M406DRAFT_65645 [Cryphonectria parasitica EP155]
MGAMAHSTPKKNKLQGACEFNDAHGIPYFKSDAFRHFGFSKSSGWAALREPEQRNGRTFHSTYSETRGRRRLIDNQRLAQLERFLESDGFDARITSWEAMPAAAGLDIEVSGRTVHRMLGTRSWRFCIACSKTWISPQLKETREKYCRGLLEKYSTDPIHWRHFRFTDKTHFGYGPQSKIYICRRPWERTCADCLVENQQPEKEMDQKQNRLHAWTAVGYDSFKDGLHWYNIPSNQNGKMNLQVYCNKILQPVFVLEEDNDSGHGGTRGNNIVRKWKEENSIVSLFNCPQSPDLIASPIERAFQGPKMYVRKQPHWDDDTLRLSAQEGFDALSVSTVNSWIDAIPQILQDCVDNDGGITGH